MDDGPQWRMENGAWSIGAPSLTPPSSLDNLFCFRFSKLSVYALMRTVQFKMVPARSSSKSRTRTWTWIRTIATWHACLPACLHAVASFSCSRHLSLSLFRFASWRSQTRLRGCYPYAVFFENRQPSLSCSALALVLALLLAGHVCDAFISVADTWNVLEPKPQQSAAPPQRWGSITWWRWRRPWCGAVRTMMKLMIVWQSSACLHDDEIMSAKAFAFIMYNILFRSPSLLLTLSHFLYLLFFSFS